MIGATLWSHVSEDCISDVQRNINDYGQIRRRDEDGKQVNWIISGPYWCNLQQRLTVADTNEWHQRDLSYIKEQIQIATDNGEGINNVSLHSLSTDVVILTHHGPSFLRTANPIHEGSSMSEAFCTDLHYMMKKPGAFRVVPSPEFNLSPTLVLWSYSLVKFGKDW